MCRKYFHFHSRNSVSNYAGFGTIILEYFNYSIERCVPQMEYEKQNKTHDVEKKQTLDEKARAKLHPSIFFQIGTDCALKLSQDNCYSDVTKTSFSTFIWTLEEAIVSQIDLENSC